MQACRPDVWTGGLALFAFADGRTECRKLKQSTPIVELRLAPPYGQPYGPPRIFCRIEKGNVDALIYREVISSHAGEGAARGGKA